MSTQLRALSHSFLLIVFLRVHSELCVSPFLGVDGSPAVTSGRHGLLSFPTAGVEIKWQNKCERTSKSTHSLTILKHNLTKNHHQKITLGQEKKMLYSRKMLVGLYLGIHTFSISKIIR